VWVFDVILEHVVPLPLWASAGAAQPVALLSPSIDCAVVDFGGQGWESDVNVGFGVSGSSARFLRAAHRGTAPAETPRCPVIDRVHYLVRTPENHNAPE